MKKLSFTCKIMLALTLIVVSTLGVVSAKGGNGSGKNSGQDLCVQSSSIKSGDKDVFTNATIDIEFSKNVVNIAVMEDNSKCFHLCDKSGNVVAIKVIFPDDQVSPKYKNHVFVTPEKELSQNSQYTLVVDNNLTAKNQTKLKKEFKLDFITGKNTTNEVSPILTELKDDVKTYKNQLPTKADKKVSTTAEKTTKKAAKKAAKKASASTKEKNNNTTKNIIIAVVIIAVALLALMLTKTKKPKEDKE